jgi:hypothetical protein
MVDQATLLNLFEYKNGKLYWKNCARPLFNGKEAGAESGHGYRKVCVYGQQLYAHRIIYMMHYGYSPKIIDHIDQNSNNNLIENLREATQSQNTINQSKNKQSTHGCRNVYYNKNRKTFTVYLKVNCKSKFFGSFKDLELAQLVAEEARDKYYGKFNFLESA